MKPTPKISDTEELLRSGYEKSDLKEEERYRRLEADWIKKQQEKANRSFMGLGFGTIAYFDIHFQLAVIFAIMLLLALPSMYLFAYWEHGDRRNDNLMHGIMLGNLGFADTRCRDTALAVDHLNLICNTGKIGRIVSFGVIPTDASVLDACLPNEETEQCNHVFNKDYVRQELELKCLGKES